MSKETQTSDAGVTEPEYFDLGADKPIQESESGEEQAPNPVEQLEGYDERLAPPTLQNLEEDFDSFLLSEELSTFSSLISFGT